MNKVNRKINEYGIFINLKCPKCEKKKCVQDLTQIDLTTPYKESKHFLYCINCHYEWEDVEGNKIEELKDYCNKIINECCKEGLKSISNLTTIIKLYKRRKKYNKEIEVREDE